MLLPREARSCFFPRLALLALSILLGLTAASAQVTANPSQLNFGDVEVGNKSTLPTVLTNNGSSPVSITKGQIQGIGFLPNAKLPITLDPGQQYTLNITFAPRGNGAYTGTLTGSNSSGPVLNIPVSGNGTQAGYSVNLTWDPSQSPPQIVGYNIYRETQSSGQYVMLNTAPIAATSFTDSAVTAGQTYSYFVKSVDSSGNLSVQSNIVTATVPTS